MMQPTSRRLSPACLTLGRLGDVTAALPIAHQIYYETGSVTPFIISREYAPILDACSYIHPVPVDLPFHKLGRAINHFRRQYSKLHVAQCYATDDVMPPKVTPSFVTDAWQRAEYLEKFGLPLVIDRRNAIRERSLLSTVHFRDPFVVVHFGGVSSPYPMTHRHELLKALRGLNVFDITNLQAEKPQDLLAVLERASCAILADSFPLHLSYALPNLPVIALQADKPNDWFGSPPRRNWIAKYRYTESITKLDEIASHAVLTMSRHAPQSFSFPLGAYNASILPHRGKCLYTWRHHPTGTWETKLSGSSGGSAVPIQLPAKANGCSHEDARLFLHNGKPHVSYTLSKFVGKQPKCVVEYGELAIGTAWKVRQSYCVEYGRNNWADMEKNHVFWSQDGKLYCLYSSHPEQVVLEIEGNTVVNEHRSAAVSWAFGEMRGDVILPHDGKLLRVFHSSEWWASHKCRYHIGVMALENREPFRVLKVNPQPLFSGDESRLKTVFHSKPNIVFTCGATVEGGDLVLALSRNDDLCTIERIPIKQLQIPRPKGAGIEPEPTPQPACRVTEHSRCDIGSSELLGD